MAVIIPSPVFGSADLGEAGTQADADQGASAAVATTANAGGAQ